MKNLLCILILSIQHVLSAQVTTDYEGHWDWCIIHEFNPISNSWKPNYSRITRTYNGFGQLEMYLSDRFDSINNIWNESSKTINVYNNSNQLIESKRSYLYSGVWDVRYKTLFFYAGNLRIQKKQEIKSISGFWEEKTKVTMSYNLNDDLNEVIEEHYVDSNWVKKTKTTYSYNSDLLNTEQQIYNWVSASSMWNLGAEKMFIYTDSLLSTVHLYNYVYNSSRLEYTYNADGQMIERAYLEFDSYSNTWKGNTRNVFFYDTDHRLEFIENYNWNHDLNTWKLSTKVNYYYHQPLNIPTVNETLNLYPQPCQSVLNLENLPSNRTINIYNINGQLINGYVDDESRINTSEYESGVYILECITPSTTIRQKFIKQ